MNYHYIRQAQYKKGFIAPLLLALIALLLIGGGAYVYVQNKQTNQPTVATSTAQAITTKSPVQPLVVDPKTAKVGDIVGPWTIARIDGLSFYSDGSAKSGSIDFTGSTVITGTIGTNDMTGQIGFTPTQEGGMQIPSFKIFDFSKAFSLRGDTQKLASTKGKIIIEIKNFGVSFIGKEGSGPHAELIRVIQMSPTAEVKSPTNQEEHGCGMGVAGGSTGCPQGYVCKLPTNHLLGANDGVCIVSDNSIGQTPSIINSPSKGDVWKTGSGHTILWKKEISATANVTSYVSISLHSVWAASNDSIQIINSSSNAMVNTGSYNWIIPSSIKPGDYKISVCPIIEADVDCTDQDYSAPFTITS